MRRTTKFSWLQHNYLFLFIRFTWTIAATYALIRYLCTILRQHLRESSATPRRRDTEEHLSIWNSVLVITCIIFVTISHKTIIIARRLLMQRNRSDNLIHSLHAIIISTINKEIIEGHHQWVIINFACIEIIILIA